MKIVMMIFVLMLPKMVTSNVLNICTKKDVLGMDILVHVLPIVVTSSV